MFHVLQDIVVVSYRSSNLCVNSLWQEGKTKPHNQTKTLLVPNNQGNNMLASINDVF